MSSTPISNISPFHHCRPKVLSDVAILMRSALKIGRTSVSATYPLPIHSVYVHCTTLRMQAVDCMRTAS
ncbi:hypothetical protein PY254_02615 [Rhodanobacter sp. AS-Z3]|uniref:hypothetical protein n=1 Tax=Rhodanobacter sp. AS-Z3 TaxID=3031330 RepID=UPI002478D1DF|nr:hypothetical protein [Rhodanobacter sp. AS-Z3]WEN15579.1 hypothetical protein PY254_02575 [Rhodanobacter sp. AS-Z3]WEN15586.1 hypothetical protein PY254_02615 [Rhodanobacter sp. AS-Z3]